MTASGTIVTVKDTTPTRGNATDTGQLFVVGMTEKGDPTTPILLRSMNDYATLLGARVTYGALYDYLDAAFHDGASSVWVGRVVGPSAVKSTIPIFDASGSANPADVALIATAVNAGAWANGIQANIIAGDVGGQFKVQVVDASSNILETSTSLADRDSAVAWSNQSSSYVRLTLGTSAENPRTQTATLASGTDDHASATTTEWTNAISLMTMDLGPGQMAAPGVTSSPILSALLAQIVATKRVGYIDGVDTATASTLTTAAAALKGGTTGRWLKFFGSTAKIPGLTPGAAARTVPWSACEAGITARNDARGRSVNQAAAGKYGRSVFATDLTTHWTDAQRSTLKDSGVNVAIMKNGIATGYENRTLADPVLQPSALQFSNARLLMSIAYDSNAVGDDFVHRMVDGAGQVLGEYEGLLIAICKRHLAAGAIFGYTVDVASVNTPTTLANHELHAVIAVQPSPGAELVYIEIDNVAITQTLAA